MNTSFENVKDTWRRLGQDDPFWAVVTWNAKRGGRWDPEEFFQTGEDDIRRYCTLLLEYAHAAAPFQHVLDFGCGVGRLSLAWSKRAQQVTGVDVSAPMLDKAQELLRDVPNVRFVLNEAADLRVLPDAQFDVVASHICLQHMPWPIASQYLLEFGRICQPGGHVAFQLPTRKLRSDWGALIRKRIVEALPFGLGKAYRRWRHRTDAVLEMYYTPAERVLAVASEAGLSLRHQEPDRSAGESTEGFIYVFAKTPR